MGDDLTQQIIGAAIEVHRELGCGLLESIYEEALVHELGIRGLPFARQMPVDIHYKGHVIKGQRLDLVVANEVVVELKSLAKLPEIALAQTLSYLRATGLRRALIINFGEQVLKNGIRRVSL
jgi:GxxExxY protein